MIAFISDIHANLPALDAVLADIAALGRIERIICLGDVVGYGPDPVECLELTASSCKLILMGNHEHALVHGALGFHPAAKRAADWTRERFQSVTPGTRRRALWSLLEHLPHRHHLDPTTLLVHGSPRDPVMEYVLESDLWDGADPSKMDAVFAGFDRLCLVGHTHRPGVFTQDRCFLPAADLPDGFTTSDGRYLINIGSVGQPRDRDPRACYAIYSGEAIYWRRVSYDVEEAVRRIRSVPELDPRFADRLLRGE